MKFLPYIYLGLNFVILVNPVFLIPKKINTKTEYIHLPTYHQIVIHSPHEQRKGFELTPSSVVTIRLAGRLAGTMYAIPTIQWELKAYPEWI